MPILDYVEPLPAPQAAGDHKLGRIAALDPRSAAFPIRALLTTNVPRSYTWSCGVNLDQDGVGACVGFSWAAEIAARPVVVPGVTNALGLGIYHDAQLIDEWPGEAYEGTSVLAGVKAAKARGYFEEYRWAFGLDDLVLAIGYKGPAVLGIPWYESMFDPDANGLLHVGGNVAGGHAILANGVNIKTKRVRLHNSWSRNWGLNGDAFISFTDLERLLSERGEACIPVRRSQP